MSSTHRLWTFLLVATTAFGQHMGGGFSHGGPSVPARSLPSGSASIRTGRVYLRSNNNGSGSPYRHNRGSYAPYGSLLSGGFYPYDSGVYSEEGEGVQDSEQPNRLMTGFMREPEPAPKPATAVIHEYKFGRQSSSASVASPAFTIVLKDGSTRSTVASWVQGGKLYYIDNQSHQQVLLPGAVNREATEQANKQNDIRMELPPGA